MSRQDHFIGLHESAEELLDKAGYYLQHVILKHVNSDDVESVLSDHTVKIPMYVKEKIEDFIEGICGNTYPLYKYTFPNGDVYEEYLQAEPWSSGPHMFLALKKDGNPVEETLWKDEEISEYI